MTLRGKQAEGRRQRSKIMLMSPNAVGLGTKAVGTGSERNGVGLANHPEVNKVRCLGKLGMVAVIVLSVPLAATGCKPAAAPLADLGEASLGIHEAPPALDYNRGTLEALPSYDPSSTDVWQVDLRSYDLSALDVTGRLDDLLGADFDTLTQWPASLPSPFDPAKVMELGSDPGLGVRSLHERGITGRGVGVAIIDQALLTDHAEYADRLCYYEEVHCLNESAQMHGPAVASILVGKTVGVAPEADLYYIAETHGTYSGNSFNWDFRYVALSIDRLLQVNDLLPAESKIRVISISVGWDGGAPGRAAADAALERAREAGIFVITTNLVGTYGLRFHGLERAPLSDPDDPSSYGLVAGWGYGGSLSGVPDILCVPMASRTTAAPNGPDEYVFYRSGGFSWCVPYLAGLYALACQVAPDVTPERFWSTALETGTPIDLTAQEPGSHGVIVNPVELIEELQGES